MGTTAIKTEQDHACAIERLLNLMSADGDENNEAIKSLASRIQEYEHKISPPINLFPFCTEKGNLSECNVR